MLAVRLGKLLKEQEEQIKNRDESLEKAREEIKWLRGMLKEQEAENGEWITIWREDDPDTSTNARCSICNRISERPLGRYCKWCGAKMEEKGNE